MGKKVIVAGIILLLLSLSFVTSVSVVYSDSPVDTRASIIDLSDKIKRLPSSLVSTQPMKGKPEGNGGGPPLQIHITYPEDGSTLSEGIHRVLVSASAKAGIQTVQLKIDGPESLGWTVITSNFDGTHYYYDWTVGTDGTYELTAAVTDGNGKSKQDTNIVYIGASTPNRWAVVIGISDYEGRGSDLWHPDEDAKEMQSELIALGYPRDNIKLLLNRKATAQAIVDAIDWLIANEEAGDEVVFFYSGHGYRASDSEGWDSDKESDDYDEMIVTYDFYGLPDGLLRDKFSYTESTTFALMFGSCHSGGMFDDNDDLQGTGRVIAAACKADQYGWDYLLLGNTLWGYYFVDEGLLDNNAYSVETAHAYAYSYVVAEQPDSQPQLWDSDPEHDFEL